MAKCKCQCKYKCKKCNGRLRGFDNTEKELDIMMVFGTFSHLVLGIDSNPITLELK